ncbi:MAG: hypothetical protein IT343_00090 [Candidatus Melainabacteria bacterium]|jgi:hypothetical protein|nr:hypothetical protein [Candidatus Melainabacteria bacterium]
MFYRILKFAGQSSYLLLGWLTWLWFHGGLSWEFSLSCLAVSGLWLTITVLGMRQLFTTYFDLFSRLKVLLPLITGVALAGLAVFTAQTDTIFYAAAGELIAWTGVYILYRRNRQQYMIKGHGPLPKGTWINPSQEALRPGDLILTSGRIATRLHESVGHGEVVVMGEDGRLMAFSSYMEHGTVYNRVEVLTRKPESRGHYVVMRLATPLSAEELELMPKLCKIMLKENDRWRNEARATRDKVLAWLPLPGFVKNFIKAKFKVTGYDWFGLLTGRRAASHWTCIGACLELYARLGVKTNRYGTGLLGLGTGLLDPIMPVRFLSDPAFVLLTEEDKKALAGGNAAATAAAVSTGGAVSA